MRFSNRSEGPKSQEHLNGISLVKVLSHEAWLDAMSDEDKALA